ncbi:MAG: hypothetical protein A2156_15400 [Deltaproteobacteria bacterium RBG_16_48_10]|nr:MAG: hypothetical protein A2156_15400 [Deltaproteobacteria bacterium RBG_16_48_10]
MLTLESFLVLRQAQGHFSAILHVWSETLSPSTGLGTLSLTLAGEALSKRKGHPLLVVCP